MHRFSTPTLEISGQKIPLPMAAAQGYDSVYILVYAMLDTLDRKLDGALIKKALEAKNLTYYGMVVTYDQSFTVQDKYAMTQNMLVMEMVKGVSVIFAYPEVANRNLFIQRK